MTISRSFVNNNQLTDYTDEILLVPNTWGLINNMGIFTTEGVTQHTITFDRTEEGISLLVDKRRGERSVYGSDETNKTYTAYVPHFPFDDRITVEDVQGVRRNGTADMEETVANVRAKKLRQMRKNHAITMEKGRMEAIRGLAYNPNGTGDVTNWYSEFGLTQKVVNSALTTAATNVIDKNEEAIAHIQDNIQDGSVITDIVVLCSPQYFSNLVKQAGVQEAYKQYLNANQGGSQVLRDRLGTGLYRTFNHGGLTYVEYRGSYGGTPLIPAGEAYALPMGEAELFMTYVSPAHKLSLANTIGEEVYAFEFPTGNDTGWELESESNMIHVPRKPEIVVKLTDQ